MQDDNKSKAPEEEPNDSSAEKAIPVPADDAQEALVSKPPSAPDRSSGGGGRGLAALALLIALGALALSGYQWWLDFQADALVEETPDYAAMIVAAEERLASRATAADRALETAVTEQAAAEEAALRRVENRLSGTDRVVAELESVWQSRLDGLERRFNVVEGSVSALARSRQDAGEDLKLAEAQFLLRLAGQRMELFDDPEGALRALRLGADQLRSLSDPVFDSVRQSVEREIAAIEQVEVPDHSALAGRISGMADQVATWPFRHDRITTRIDENLLSPQEDDTGWWRRTKLLLGEVITVRSPGAGMEILNVTEQRLVRENLRLQLEIARLAAVREEQALFEDSIDRVMATIDTYFDTGDETVAAARRRLEEARVAQLEADYPPLGQSLRQLRNLSAAVELAEGEAP